MTEAHMIALALIPLGAIPGAMAAAWSGRVRDIFFFAMVSLAVVAERMDVNFFSEAWYRGTTRGVEVTLVELLAFALLMGCWLGRRGAERRMFWPGSLGLQLLYFAYACVSVIFSHPRIFGVFELTKIFAGILVFLASAAYVRSRREWTLLVVALGCAVGFEGVWALKQHFIMHLPRVAGTLDHANSLSMYFCLTVPLLVAVALSGWSRGLSLFCGLCALAGCAGLTMTLSRAGIPIFAAVVAGTVLACASWRLTPRRIAVRTILVLGVIAMVAECWTAMGQRYSESSLEDEYFNPAVDGRGVYLRLSAAIVRDHILGVGLNNWSYDVSRLYGPRIGYRFEDYDFLTSVYGTANDKQFANSYLAAPAHNLAALTLGELGIPGLVIFALLWFRWLSMAAPFLLLPRGEPMRAMGVGLLFCICGIFGQSLTEWVYRQTPILLTFSILLGALASLAHARRQASVEPILAASAEDKPDAIPRECLVAEGV
jgi:O-Antigen ligase